jgi:hypothetical protein
MSTPNDQPLWQAMRHAYDQSSVPTALIESSDPETGDCLTDRYGYAAELRAIADRVVPEEYLPEPDEESMMDMRVWEAVSQRQRIRAVLLAEADRAEAGE